MTHKEQLEAEIGVIEYTISLVTDLVSQLRTNLAICEKHGFNDYELEDAEGYPEKAFVAIDGLRTLARDLPCYHDEIAFAEKQKQ